MSDPTTARPEPGGETGRGTERPALAHVPALDGMRGFAVLAVLAFHAGRLPGGWLGVDAFFVLSGYLITTLLLVDRARLGRIRLGRFWVRRVRRLGPALVATTLATSVFVAVRTDPYQRDRFRWDAFATLFEVMNWRTILTAGDYWSQWSAPSPLRHAWSLSIEEQVYLFWPLVVAAVLVRFRRPLAVAVTAGAGVLLSLASMFRLEAIGADVNRIYLGTDTRVAAVLLGALLAAWRLHLGPRRWRATRRARILVGSAAVVPLVYLWVVLDGEARSTYRIWLPVASVLAALLTASLADRSDGGPLGRLFALPAVVHLGRVSYGLYLYHWPIYLLFDDHPERMGLPTMVVALVISWLLAAASYRWLEHPIRRGTVLRGRPGRAAVPGAIALAVLAILAATLDSSSRSADWDRFFARSSDPDAPTVVYAGDSIPLLLGRTAASQVDELGINVGSVAVAGCHVMHEEGAIRDIGGEIHEDLDCGGPDRVREGVLSYRPDLSILLYGVIHNNDVMIDGRWQLPCEAGFDEVFRRRIERTVDDLTTTDAPVVLVSSSGSTVSWVVDGAPPGMNERVGCLNDILRDIASERPDVGFVDLDAWICPTEDHCLEEIDGIDLRPDTVHFEGESAELVNRWLIPRAFEAVGVPYDP